MLKKFHCSLNVTKIMLYLRTYPSQFCNNIPLDFLILNQTKNYIFRLSGLYYRISDNKQRLNIRYLACLIPNYNSFWYIST